MTPEDHLNTLIKYYSRITNFPDKYKDILNIDKPLRWILADVKEQYVSVYNKTQEQYLVDVDIISCFPTVCKFLFNDTNPRFIEDIARLPNKLDKNILIANTLKGTQYLKILNIVSKMVILGFIFDRQDSKCISLLEYEKDGCLIFIDNKFYYNNINNTICETPFQEFVIANDFKFRVVNFEYYIRCNNTSWFWSNKLRIKGMYKHIPKKILEFYNDVFLGTTVDITKYSDIYNKISLKFIRENNLQEILRDYYFCGDDQRILNTSGRYEKYGWKSSQIDPLIYLRTFIYPIWVFQQRNLAGLN